MAESKGGSAVQSRDLQTTRQQSQSRGHELTRFGAAADPFTNPFQFMRRITQEMDRAFDRAFGGVPGARDTAWLPRIEQFQKDDRFVVRAELPGLKKEDVHVNVTDQAIIIEGQRQNELEEQRDGYYHSERSYGSFYRAVPLPDGVIAESADASFRDGVLEVSLHAPPREVTRGRKVEIRDGAKK